MEPSSWLLLLIGSSTRPDGLDPVRVQKGMFLLAHEAGLPADERYVFRPYNYGPMSVAVYDDVRALVAARLVERIAVSGHHWRSVRLTPSGEVQACRIEAEAERTAPIALRRLRRIVTLLDELDFAGLLEAVYTRYPDYAARSVFRR